jgi:hypothetical protein
MRASRTIIALVTATFAGGEPSRSYYPAPAPYYAPPVIVTAPPPNPLAEIAGGIFGIVGGAVALPATVLDGLFGATAAPQAWFVPCSAYSSYPQPAYDPGQGGQGPYPPPASRSPGGGLPTSRAGRCRGIPAGGPPGAMINTDVLPLRCPAIAEGDRMFIAKAKLNQIAKSFRFLVGSMVGGDSLGLADAPRCFPCAWLAPWPSRNWGRDRGHIPNPETTPPPSRRRQPRRR